MAETNNVVDLHPRRCVIMRTEGYDDTTPEDLVVSLLQGVATTAPGIPGFQELMLMRDPRDERIALLCRFPYDSWDYWQNFLSGDEVDESFPKREACADPQCQHSFVLLTDVSGLTARLHLQWYVDDWPDTPPRNALEQRIMQALRRWQELPDDRLLVAAERLEQLVDDVLAKESNGG